MPFFSPTFPRAVGNPPFPRWNNDARIAKREYLPEGVLPSVSVSTPSRSSARLSDPGTFVALRLLYDATSIQGTLEQRVEALGYLPEQQQLLRFTERSGLSIIAGATRTWQVYTPKHVMEGMAEEPHSKLHDAGRSGGIRDQRTKQRNVITNTNVETPEKWRW